MILLPLVSPPELFFTTDQFFLPSYTLQLVVKSLNKDRRIDNVFLSVFIFTPPFYVFIRNGPDTSPEVQFSAGLQYQILKLQIVPVILFGVSSDNFCTHSVKRYSFLVCFSTSTRLVSKSYPLDLKYLHHCKLLSLPNDS